MMPSKFSALCVFCGSSVGHDAPHQAAAVELADWMTTRNVTLVYGGANVGLMRVLADRVLTRGGRVYGVIPEMLMSRELAHTGLTELFVTHSMHARKQKMYELADGFIAMSGGLGTLDEIFEIITWAQLGLHQKPCGLLNVAGYFNHLLHFLDSTVRSGFVKAEHRAAVLADTTVAGLCEQMQRSRSPRFHHPASHG